MKGMAALPAVLTATGLLDQQFSEVCRGEPVGRRNSKSRNCRRGHQRRRNAGRYHRCTGAGDWHAILERRGSVVDAAIATAMAQITLAAGSWVSFAGICEIVNYDADTGKVSNLDGGFNTVRNETDYKGVPSISLNPLSKVAQPGHFNVRTVMVPG